MNFNTRFWQSLDKLVSEHRLIIDRPRHSAHPRYPEFIYPLDYGYLEGTSGGDGDGIDVWRGSQKGQGVQAIICTVDLAKKDAEIKILLNCTEEERQIILNFVNTELQSGILVKR